MTPTHGRPKTATTPQMIEKVHDIVLNDRRVKIPCRINIDGNELTDALAKEGQEHPIPTTSEYSCLELFPWQKAQNKEKWLKSPFHKWYKGKGPELSLSLPCDKQFNTCLSRLASGHLKFYFLSKL
ncbi:ig-like domain-containing protein [Trichonephila clavipes]|nr:ig-like domain-containing protein [Trichonephila clavipes]